MDKGQSTSDVALTNQQLADLAAGVTVRMWALDEHGKPRIDPASKQHMAEDRPIAAEHIIGSRVAGDKVTIVTVDGQKIVRRLPGRA